METYITTKTAAHIAPISGMNRMGRDVTATGCQLTLDFSAAAASPIVDLQICHDSPYPPAPSVIQAGWHALIPAILELSFHSSADELTLLQSVRKTKNLRGSGSRAARDDTFEQDNSVLDGWLYDVLVPIGTLPIENVESSEKFSLAGAERLVSQLDEPYDANISAQSRNEAMMCLEMLCAKVWYERNRQGRSEAFIRNSILSALEFMYWECGIPTSLTFLWDDPPPLWHPTYEQVRQFNYRQLYAIEQEGLVSALVSRIEQGVKALSERRDYFNRRFERSNLKDARWSRSFSKQVEAIKVKYASTSED
jgi:hypothetical protein